MKSLIKRITLTLASAGMLLFPILVPATAMAAPAATPEQSLCAGANLTTDFESADCNDPNATTRVDETVSLAINIFSWIVGVAAVIMIMVGGMMYITSGGDSGKVGKAKDAILYAIVGLVVVAIAQIIVRFVLTSVTEN